MNIISIGDLVTDFYYKDNKLIGVNGGMTSHNIIANLSVLGHSTKVVGVCGDDVTGNIAIKSLMDLGVNVSSIIKKDIPTRCFHVSYFEKNGKLEFASKKRCPVCNNKKWYECSEIDVAKAKKEIKKEDLIVIDNLNDKNMQIIEKLPNDIMLDLGQYFEFENKTNKEIKSLLSNKFCIIQMNERVEKYLLKRFEAKGSKNLYTLIKPKLLVVTRGKKGADFVFNGKIIKQKTAKIIKEVDSSGAGDAFFSCVIDSYLNNNRMISSEMINVAYSNAVRTTSKVIKKIGARGHLRELYKVKLIKGTCACEDFKIVQKRKHKRVYININFLERRVLNSITSNATKEIEPLLKNLKTSSLFIGTGGSFAAAYFASRVTNEINGTTTLATYPREVIYRNNNDIDKFFLFSYSGTTPDLLNSVKNYNSNKVVIITKGTKSKLLTKTDFKRKNVISYNNGLCTGQERGFLSFEGAVAPAALFLNLLLKDETAKFIKQSFSHWNEYFKVCFKNNQKKFKELLCKDNVLTLFKGDYTNTAALDLESKIIESGIYNLITHEKKNFSHGRFINLENQKIDCYIYLKQKTSTKYEKLLLNYLKKDKTIVIESQFDGLKAEFDLLVASQFFMYYISVLLNIDISKPNYSDKSMKIYSYKGIL